MRRREELAFGFDDAVIVLVIHNSMRSIIELMGKLGYNAAKCYRSDRDSYPCPQRFNQLPLCIAAQGWIFYLVDDQKRANTVPLAMPLQWTNGR